MCFDGGGVRAAPERHDGLSCQGLKGAVEVLEELAAKATAYEASTARGR
jgi:hypothetical protein